MKILLLIRGAPGSGKTTIAKALVMDYLFDKHYEADQFFTSMGVYKFVPERIPQAHKWCQFNVDEAMREGHNVVVSNTFTEFWQMEPYYKLAVKHEYQVQVMILSEPIFKNTHGVPQEKVDEMQNRLWRSLKRCYDGAFE